MRKILTLQSGAVSACLLLLLSGCGTERPIIKPVVVRERVPVYVALPAELTAPLAKPVLVGAEPTNDDLQQLAEARGTVIDHLLRRLEEIRKLQPPQAAP